jgi:hypothetical protein
MLFIWNYCYKISKPRGKYGAIFSEARERLQSELHDEKHAGAPLLRIHHLAGLAEKAAPTLSEAEQALSE